MGLSICRSFSLFALWLVGACAGLQEPRFNVREIADSFRDSHPFYWLDNKRLVITALSPGSPLLDGQRQYTSYILDVETGEASKLPSGSYPGCFYRGYRVYVQQENDNFVTYAGTF